MPSVEEYNIKIVELQKKRQEADDEISRLQNIANNLSQREDVITDLKKQILAYDVSAEELFPKKK